MTNKSMDTVFTNHADTYVAQCKMKQQGVSLNWLKVNEYGTLQHGSFAGRLFFWLQPCGTLCRLRSGVARSVLIIPVRISAFRRMAPGRPKRSLTWLTR